MPFRRSCRDAPVPCVVHLACSGILRKNALSHHTPSSGNFPAPGFRCAELSQAGIFPGISKKKRMKFPAFFATGQKAAVPRCRRFSGTVHTGQNAGELFRTFRKLRNPFQRVGDGMVRLSPLSCFTPPSSWPGRISSSRPVLPRSASPHRPRCRRRGSKHTRYRACRFRSPFCIHAHQIRFKRLLHDASSHVYLTME